MTTPSLPTVGGDSNSWGTQINAWLLASHNDDGSSPFWVSVKDPEFGAAGDGSTDDTDAIQDALDQAASDKRAVIFPPGDYLITSGLTWTSTVPCVLIGASTKGLGFPSGGTSIVMNFAPGHALDVQNTHYFHMRDIDFIAAVAYTPGYPPRCVNVPMLVMAGRADPLVMPERLGEWAGYTARECAVQLHQGGHFALLDQPEELAQALRRWTVQAAREAR